MGDDGHDKQSRAAAADKLLVGDDPASSGTASAVKRVANPASSGPAGTGFEADVAAHYLLAMAADAEGRGFSGITIDEVGLQRAAVGFPLDDVVVMGKATSGERVTLEIQVKRTITFAPGDGVFADVAAQLAQAIVAGALDEPQRFFAVATARRSAKIDGPYQDVLVWARRLDPGDLARRLSMQGEAGADARRFVQTLREHLLANGAAADDETIGRLLRRFSILTFDFGTAGSADDVLSVERATRALDPSSAGGPAALWTSLAHAAITTAAAGGGVIQQDELLYSLTRDARFTLAGRRRYAAASEAIGEMTAHSLADMRVDIAGVQLPRDAALAAVDLALDAGRYLEIRGEAGTGKSVLLRQIAERAGARGRTLLLAPNRTPGPGWAALKAQLGAPGTARELLSDLAAQGGATLLIDSLDFLTAAERATVRDLVREAAGVPGFRVIATARPEFGVDEPGWVPVEAIAALGAAPTVVVADLDTAELEELRSAAPSLAALLAPGHPASKLARNPFRLARLANLRDQGATLRSEIDMAEQWWSSGDGEASGRRERRRILAALGEAALTPAGQIDVGGHNAEAVDALVRSGSLSEVALDRVAPRHDVIREWAGAMLLSDRPDVLATLPLERPMPSALGRIVELAARFRLERGDDGQAWIDLLTSLQTLRAHLSWRRPALVAIVRSELGAELLNRAKSVLLADGGIMLRELIGTSLGVDAKPARDAFAQAGVDLSAWPEGIFVPNGPAWSRLVNWCVQNRDDLPAACVEEVVQLFWRYSLATLGLDPRTPAMLAVVLDWLLEIEHRYMNDQDPAPRRLRGLDYRAQLRLEADLRLMLTSLAHRAPELARRYLDDVATNDRADRDIDPIVTHPNMLVVAAPAELARLTLKGLIPPPRGRDGYQQIGRDGPFTHLDSLFLPASPAQGPFFGLLTHVPAVGLQLIRDLVAHAIGYYTAGREAGDDGFLIALASGPRMFAWQRSYGWSGPLSHPYAVASGLMALEAWAHLRIERGDDVEAVLADVLGPEGAPAAVLLVAVHLLISHWPNTRAAAVPFLACPELLSIDRERQAMEEVRMPDPFGLNIDKKEPTGPVRLSDLAERASRAVSLEYLLGLVAMGPDDHVAADLKQRLRDQVQRLGPPAARVDFRDPAFMARHALARADRSNYHSVDDGFQYEPPADEARDLAALQAERAQRSADFATSSALFLALEDPDKSSLGLAARGMDFGQRHRADLGADDGGEHWANGQAVLSAALVAARDGDDALVHEHGAWIRDVLDAAIATESDAVHRSRGGLSYNPKAIAAAGYAHLWSRHGAAVDRHRLLGLAASPDPASAYGFRSALSVLIAKDCRMPAAVLRCGLATSVFPAKLAQLTGDDRRVALEERDNRAAAAARAEAAWLDDQGPEPAWPDFPAYRRIMRRRMYIGDRRDDDAVDHIEMDWRVDQQAASLWLTNVAEALDYTYDPLLAGLVAAYADWTAAANGSGLEDGRELQSAPDEWNERFYGLPPRLAGTLGSTRLEQLVTQITALPERHFLDIGRRLIAATDVAFLDLDAIPVAEAVRLRDLLADRLITSNGWRWAATDASTSIERHLGSHVAAQLMNVYHGFDTPKSYLLPELVDRLTPFIPSMRRLFDSGPVFMVALCTFNLLEVAPRADHASFLLAGMAAWLTRTGDSGLIWVDQGLGRRAAALLNAYLTQDPALAGPSHPEHILLRDVLAALVKVGVAEAAITETRLETQ